MSRPAKTLSVGWPRKGLVEQMAFSGHDLETTLDCLNVLPYDTSDHRLRGGQRPGLTKFFDEQLAQGGSNRVTYLKTATVPLDEFEYIQEQLLLETDFTALSTQSPLSHADYTTFQDGLTPSGSWNLTAGDATRGARIINDVSSGLNVLSKLMTSGGGVGVQFSDTTGTSSGQYSVQMDLRANANGDTTRFIVGMIDVPGSGDNADLNPRASFTLERENGTTARFIFRTDNPAASDTAFTDITVNTWPNMTMRVDVVGTLIMVYLNGVRVIERDMADLSSGIVYEGDNFGIQFQTTSPIHVKNLKLYSLSRPLFGLTEKIMAVVGADVYSGFSGGELVLGNTTGTGLTAGSEALVMIEAPASPNDDSTDQRYVYMSDGTRYLRLNMNTAAVEPWYAFNGVDALTTDTISGSMPYKLGTAQTITAIDITGDNDITVAGDQTAVFAENSAVVISGGASTNDGSYLITSVNLSGGDTVLTLEEELASDTVQGTVAPIESTARIGTLYRGRIVLSGLESDPQNWFMSAVDDSRNWDYSPPSVTETIAVAGNQQSAGKVPDIVTCLAAFGDDLMIIGCDRSVWVMRGDPAAGGEIDNISYATGIVGPNAFAWHPNGSMFFMGQLGVYILPPGASGTPVLLAKNKLDKTFLDLDLNTLNVFLEWDDARQGLWVFLIPRSGTNTDHYFWDERTDSWWPMQFPASMVTAVTSYNGKGLEEKTVLLAGSDGYVRSLVDSADDDDGTAISSHVVVGPFGLPTFEKARISDLEVVTGEGSDDVTLKVYAAGTPERAFDATTPLLTSDLTGGRSKNFRQTISGNAFVFKLENTTNDETWYGLEQLTFNITPAGRHRGAKGRV